MTTTVKDRVLLVQQLKVDLDGVKILEGVDFELKKGESLVILGPNGAGKTTLLRALLGIIPYEGKVEWMGGKIGYLPPNELLKRKSLLPLTVSDFYGLKGVSQDRVKISLEEVGLSALILRRKIADLSTGQFQRLSIAWTMVNRPEVLILDEPTSGIDVGGMETVYTLLHRYWERYKLSLIMVTHDLSVIWEHADNVLCLNKKKVCYGPPISKLTPKVLEKLYGTGVSLHRHVSGGER